MPKSKAKMMADLRARRKWEEERPMRERSELFVDFCKTFPGAFTVDVAPATDADPDLKEPIRVRLKFDETIKPDLVRYAHRSGMSVDLLFDRLTEEVVERMRKRGLIPDRPRDLIE